MTYRSFIIQWNNDHPLDRKFREKYNIAFNSVEHRKSNQLDILLEYVESKCFEDAEQHFSLEQEKLTKYENGVWISEREVSEDQSLDLFEKINIASINNKDSQIQFE
jgi:hypothetical protein